MQYSRPFVSAGTSVRTRWQKPQRRLGMVFAWPIRSPRNLNGGKAPVPRRIDVPTPSLRSVPNRPASTKSPCLRAASKVVYEARGGVRLAEVATDQAVGPGLEVDGDIAVRDRLKLDRGMPAGVDMAEIEDQGSTGPTGPSCDDRAQALFSQGAPPAIARCRRHKGTTDRRSPVLAPLRTERRSAPTSDSY